jgi:peroxiredoxin Q/BCP
VAYFAASVDSLEDNTAFAQHVEADYPILADPTKQTARAFGVLSPLRVAHRWTYYIGADGRLLHIDKKISTGSAGADIAATLERLGVARRSAGPAGIAP